MKIQLQISWVGQSTRISWNRSSGCPFFFSIAYWEGQSLKDALYQNIQKWSLKFLDSFYIFTIPLSWYNSLWDENDKIFSLRIAQSLSPKVPQAAEATDCPSQARRITHENSWPQTIWWSSKQDNLIIPSGSSTGNEIRKMVSSSQSSTLCRGTTLWSIVTNAPNFPARSLLSISEIALAADRAPVTTAATTLDCDRTNGSTSCFLAPPSSARSVTETSSSQAANSRWRRTKSAGWGRHMSTTRGRGGKN